MVVWWRPCPVLSNSLGFYYSLNPASQVEDFWSVFLQFDKRYIVLWLNIKASNYELWPRPFPFIVNLWSFICEWKDSNCLWDSFLCLMYWLKKHLFIYALCQRIDLNSCHGHSQNRDSPSNIQSCYLVSLEDYRLKSGKLFAYVWAIMDDFWIFTFCRMKEIPLFLWLLRIWCHVENFISTAKAKNPVYSHYL